MFVFFVIAHFLRSLNPNSNETWEAIRLIDFGKTHAFGFTEAKDQLYCIPPKQHQRKKKNKSFL